MKTYKITKGNKQYVIKARDAHCAIAKLQTFLKDSKHIKDYDKENEQERNKKIQQLANKTGLSFASAKRMLEEIESGNDSDYEEMSEMLRDDRLSPMTYKKLKEMGYNSDKWKNLTQEEANKIVAKSNSSSKPKTETPKQEAKQPKNNSGAIKSELGNSINPELVKKYPNLHKDLGKLASANSRVRELSDSYNAKDRDKAYALSDKIVAYLDKHYPDTLGDDLGADSLLDTIGDEDRFEKAFLDILENGKPEIVPEETESAKSEEGPSKELQELIANKPNTLESATEQGNKLWEQINKDIAKRGSNIVKASDGSDYTFDITDGSSYSKAYKAALAGAPVSVDGHIAKIENLSPDGYLRACAAQKEQSVKQMMEDRIDENYYKLVKELGKSKTINNSIWLDRNANQQEGIHRAMALKKLGVENIPTLVVSNKQVPKEQKDKYLSF